MIAANGITNVNGYVNGNGAGTEALVAPVALPLPSLEEIRGLNVHQRIRWVTAEAKSLPRSQYNPEGAFQYAGHDQIVDMLRALLAKYGVNIYQEPLEFEREATLGGIEQLTRVWYEYEVVNADQPDDKFVRHNWGEALDNGDKGLNKCSTIAEKVFMLRLFKISTFDDPDAHSAEKALHQAVPQNGDQGRGSRGSRPAQNECQNCHEPITTARRGNKTWQSSEVVAASRKAFGKRLCVDCYLSELKKTNRASGDDGTTATQREPTDLAASATGSVSSTPTAPDRDKQGS